MELYDETPPNLPDVSRVGTWGWGLLLAGVVAWDVLADETLSKACQRGLENKYTGPVVAMTLGYVTCHLAGVIPERADVLKTLAKKIK